ncbi:MAG: hypothetical protein G01um101420_649 [Parcubacteria group bacterium Gr01-1014_20]|nr:MAG: hypothetical protein G01um101420_649 [Parcubacteria group bacterium Gr01-1014_20]
MDFLGWLVLQIFKGGGFVLEHWRWFLGGVGAIIFIFVLPEKMRHLSNSITKMIDACYLLLGRITRYFLSLAVIAIVVYGLYHVGNWRGLPENTKRSSTTDNSRHIQEPTAKDLANAEARKDQPK